MHDTMWSLLVLIRGTSYTLRHFVVRARARANDVPSGKHGCSNAARARVHRVRTRTRARSGLIYKSATVRSSFKQYISFCIFLNSNFTRSPKVWYKSTIYKLCIYVGLYISIQFSECQSHQPMDCIHNYYSLS